jgi:molybdopterin converting factor subunit 1
MPGGGIVQPVRLCYDPHGRFTAMQTRVLLFAALREAAGGRELVLDLPAGTPISELRARLAAEWPRLGPLLGNAAAAVNEEYVPGDHVLRDGDVVALIPPVSGG